MSSIIENLNEPRGHQTEFLLRSISSRLSGRDDCRKTVYTVKIDHNGVQMSPLIYVYPSKYKRKETDRIDIVSFVHQYKMNKAMLSQFVFGTYVYDLSGDTKSRRWRKVD